MGAWNSRTGTRGQDPGYFAKALLTIMATLGVSAHFDDNYKELQFGEGGRYRIVFDWIENAAARLVGRAPQPFAPKEYAKALEQVRLIVDATKNKGVLATGPCIAVNIELVKQLSALHPAIGRRLGIDGMLIKAWVQQVGTQATWEKELRVRRRAVDATARKVGKRFQRGYYLFVLTDLASNLPVIWGLYPSGTGNPDKPEPEKQLERRALRFLLSELFEYRPGCPVENIVADRAWDNVDAIRECAVLFGIHLIAGRDDPSWNRKPTELPEERFPAIGKFDGRGVVHCRQHGVAMRRDSSRFIGRKQRAALRLAPGEPARAAQFTLRLRCPIGGGDCDHLIDLPMGLDRAAPSYYPHTTDGGRPTGPAEYACFAGNFRRGNS